MKREILSSTPLKLHGHSHMPKQLLKYSWEKNKNKDRFLYVWKRLHQIVWSEEEKIGVLNSFKMKITRIVFKFQLVQICL